MLQSLPSSKYRTCPAFLGRTHPAFLASEVVARLTTGTKVGKMGRPPMRGPSTR